MGCCRQPFRTYLGGPSLGIVARAFARRWLLVGPESTALVLAIGRFVEKSHVHLPVGQPHDLALFHRGRGTRLGRQRVVQRACAGPNHFVCHFICSLRVACALALSNGARRR